MQRMTIRRLEMKVDRVNRSLGFTLPESDDPIGFVPGLPDGSVRLYQAYGATAVHQMSGPGHGVTQLSGLGTMREAAHFLDGMAAGIRAAGDRA